MKVIDVRNIEDCLDGSFIRELMVDSNITKNFIDFFAKLGKLYYYGTFTRPFFKIDGNPDFLAKGVEGNNTIRIHFFNKEILNKIELHIQSFNY